MNEKTLRIDNNNDMNFVYKLPFLAILLTYNAHADSFDDFILEVSVASGVTSQDTERVISKTFQVIKNRMLNDKATSIPEFGRFYTHEKEKRNQKDSDGYFLSPRTVRTPKFIYATEFKKKMEKLD